MLYRSMICNCPRIIYIYRREDLSYSCLGNRTTAKSNGYNEPYDSAQALFANLWLLWNKHRLLVIGALMAFISISLSSVSCSKPPVSFSPEERKAVDSLVRSVRNVDSLALLQKRLEREGNRLGSIVALREWGKALRNESRFDEALNAHSEGLRQAEAIGDTLEWIQALNNIGTDYRRLGIFDVAQEYHYQAYTISLECADTSYGAKKNRVVSLNGLGNVYMTLRNYARADSAFRLALVGEQELHSATGQAINFANMGSIFEQQGKIDSAWVYYRRSMAFNREAGNKLGISLCHTYFGSLYEKAKEYDKATQEYETAYSLMQASKDEWHVLNTLVALAGIYYTTGNDPKTLDYLDKAKAIAEQIKSREHLANIHTLYYKLYKRQGAKGAALSAYEVATAMQDSILDVEKINRIQNTSLNIERSRKEKQMSAAQLKLEEERMWHRVGYGIFALLLLFLIGFITMQLYIQRLRVRNHRALKQMSALRENFFTNITHELRTPLTVILRLSRDVQEATECPPEIKDKVQTIERQGNGLLTLINQLLDISKVKSAVGDPDWYNGNITIYLTMIVESYREYARNQDIDLQFLSKGSVEMDFIPDYVKKVMNNLLSNAFKFTPKYGKVSVIVWSEDNQLLIDVMDTGKGISREALSHIFEPFYQAEGNTRNIGTGVGLALVKQVIDSVEGCIKVESTENRGTTFHISVPIRNQCKRQLTDQEEANNPLLPEIGAIPLDSEKEDNECRLLIIEDNQDIATYIGSLFSDSYAISYASNGEEGLQKTLDLVPDLIITDLMMPEMDGLEVCRQIRSNEIVNHIPIIVVTAKITEEERIKGIQAGADAYLSKPFSSEELRTRVEKLLDRHRRLRHKFGEKADASTKDKEESLTEAERRFLAKTVDSIYILLSKQQLEVNTLAEKLCMSPRQFHRKIIALTGDTPASYMLKIKMQKARLLLEGSPELKIEDIAERCGFEHSSSFYHAFRKVYGITPTEYKRSCAGKG